MTPDEERELDGLRARAYGPGADIQHDPAALRRLRELESGRAAAVSDATGGAGDLVAPLAPTLLLAPPTESAGQVPDSAHRSRSRGRRILTALAIVAAVAVVAGVLFALRQDRGDPLRTGAKEVARLPVDPNYTVPAALRGNGDTGDAADQIPPVNAITGFREFHGLRVVVGTGSRFDSPDGEACLLVFPAEGASGPAPATYSEQEWTGCAAGAFPATAQLEVTSELPTATRAAFPGGMALQFVYDKADNEVVVFAAKPASH